MATGLSAQGSARAAIEVAEGDATTPTRLLYEVLAFERVGGYGFNGGLGPDQGRNLKDHSASVDFNFQYGYWED